MSTAPGVRVPGSRDADNGTTPLSDPLLHAETRKRICGWCQEHEATLECASCARVYCIDCSRAAHKLAKNSNHRVTFIDVRPGNITTPSRTSQQQQQQERETLDDILTNIGSALKPDVARIDERSFGTPDYSINVSRGDVRAHPPPHLIDEVQAPPSHGSITESLLGMDDRAERRRYIRRVGVTVAVMILLFLVQLARTCYLYGGVLLGSDATVVQYNFASSILFSLGYTGVKHGLFVVLGLLSFVVTCNRGEAFPRSLFNIYSLFAGSFIIVATVTQWWQYTQRAAREIEENVIQILFAWSIIFIPWLSVFFRPERTSVRTLVVCLNLSVGGMLACYSIYSSLAMPSFSTTMLLLCYTFIFPPLSLGLLRLSAHTVGVTKSLFGVGIAVIVVLIPLSIVAERHLWEEFFRSDHSFVLKVLGAFALDVLVLVLTTTLACLLKMTDFGYFVYAAMLFTDRKLALSFFEGTYGWNVYHVVGLCLMVLSLIVWAFDLKTYFDRANKFL